MLPKTIGNASRSPTPRPHELARYAVIIEKHYGRPMDIEWGRDGVDGKLYILQARPETVKSRESVGNLRRYRLKSTSERARERPRDRPEDRAGHRARSSSRRRRWIACRQATCWSPT